MGSKALVQLAPISNSTLMFPSSLISSLATNELLLLPKNQLEGLLLYKSLVRLSNLGLNPTDYRLSDLLKQMFCDSLPLILCSLACIHVILLDDFPCTHSKFFSLGSFFHYGPCLLVGCNQNKVSTLSETSFCLQLHLLIAVASIKVMNLLTHRES